MKIRTKRLVGCIEHMKALHKGQTRRMTGTPYWVHPLGVLQLMEESPFFFTEDDKCAALLHDIKEDSPGFSWDNVVATYGLGVAGAIAILSKSKIGETAPEVYFTMLRLTHPKVIAIKLLDRLQNTSDYNLCNDPKWLERYAKETVELVWPLIPIMVARGSAVSGGFYELGVKIEEQMQENVNGMQARAKELRAGGEA
jgi:(p)ppGpp synthase/HD superfamily hydrolase